MSDSIKKTYSPSEVENKWYAYWMQQGYFHAKPNPSKEPYCIVIPPPNVTGVLHMGHMLNNTIQDVLVRRARMQGKEACWVPGTDHASIATEAKVVALLREQGIKKSDLSRDAFLGHAWNWKEKYGGIILQQLKKLGASCDWDRTRFTMEPNLSEAVLEVFVRLYKDGLIYRGHRMVNWDPEGKTALSDEEVIHKDVQSKLYYIKYPVEGSNDFAIVATTRPETLLGDTAVCIHPKDERWQHLKGKKVLLPLLQKPIPIIEDEYVDLEFGTGCLKVTPAHDMNDYQLGQKHGLEVIDIMNDDGTFNDKAQLYIGQDRFKVRKLIVSDLEEKGFLIKVEDLKNSIGYSERTNAVVEPRLSLQWFVDMKAFMQKHPQVLDDVMNDNIQLHPAKFKNTYKHWIENIKDWCISRQLWWGQRIPAWYLPDGSYVVALDASAALKEAQQMHPGITIEDLKQDEDVLDTWFSSWLWPISVFDGFKDPQNDAIKYFYPTHDLVTAPEILFFWVARMIMAGYAFNGQAPFKNVYLTGIVRDKQGRKMSKSLGNSPDPLDLIQVYGADGVRFGMLLSSPAGNDLLFDEKYCEQGRNFSNKIWNAYRLIKSWDVQSELEYTNAPAVDWLEAKIHSVLVEIEDHFQKYKLSDALMAMYKLVWDDFCAWYLEMIKPEFGKPMDATTYAKTITLFETLLRIVHPFMPFLSEELWQEIKQRSSSEALIVSAWPTSTVINSAALQQGNMILEVISSIRNIRSAKQLTKEDKPELYIKSNQYDVYQSFASIIIKLSGCSSIQATKEKIDGATTFILKNDEFYLPIELSTEDQEKEKERIEKELAYVKGFLVSVEKKLSNERFVSGAPATVLENERQKQADALAKINALETALKELIGSL